MMLTYFWDEAGSVNSLAELNLIIKYEKSFVLSCHTGLYNSRYKITFFFFTWHVPHVERKKVKFTIGLDVLLQQK